jgi:hypothetical protein
MRFRLHRPDARRRYARRKAVVGPAFGQLKDVSGLARAASGYLLACPAYNLGKLLGVCPLPGAQPTVMATGPARPLADRVASGPADIKQPIAALDCPDDRLAPPATPHCPDPCPTLIARAKMACQTGGHRPALGCMSELASSQSPVRLGRIAATRPGGSYQRCPS